MFSVTLTVVVLPAPSRAVPETTWSAPSVVTVCAGGQSARPLPPLSLQENVTRTLERYQPLALRGVPSTDSAVAVIFGGDESGRGAAKQPFEASKPIKTK